MGQSMEDDLRLGQIAVRMGLLSAQDLPGLIQEARAASGLARPDAAERVIAAVLDTLSP